MLINYTLLLAVAIVVGLALAWFSFRFFMKRKKYVTGGFVGFFMGVIPAMGIAMMNATAYVVTGKKEYTTYAVYGSPEFEMGNGTKTKIEVPIQKCVVINNSADELVIEKVIYGYGSGNATDIVVEPYRAHTLSKASKVNHFFDDKPPHQVESENYGNVMLYWLRTKKDYDQDYPNSIEADKIEKLKERLQEIKEKKAQESATEEETAE